MVRSSKIVIHKLEELKKKCRERCRRVSRLFSGRFWVRDGVRVRVRDWVGSTPRALIPSSEVIPNTNNGGNQCPDLSGSTASYQ